MSEAKVEKLISILRDMEECSVAVSGGVDSMTLSFLAHRELGSRATMVHAISPAVPKEATERVSFYAQKEGWNLRVVNAGEMSNEDYLANPVNRCYFCKSSLYGTINNLDAGNVISGTNMDDLSDFRPGLLAAKESRVRHPFVEAGISKAELRQIAADFKLADLAQLPSSPCLASRVQTGIRINARDLGLIERIETFVRSQVVATNIRCRLVDEGFRIEIDQPIFDAISEQEKSDLIGSISHAVADIGDHEQILIAAYRQGSAFNRIATWK
ncbi:uncharacterized protein SAMN04515647_1287 [Cohaesibacter sp. ES.047]|uniref:adenine nucleotide alpha hydrolase n=1 Tax=Cohaesibacter sp. ES.047 TaxID=1798205 RepID=UPI000BB75D9F|nr:adenine nucleotide alpha hydrolase [Cohaesibacter sp. ES.047]SNY91083.1 uncharacterized protein SAMN04515647_1287 [Cohaesibacter sp. ES.047]